MRRIHWAQVCVLLVGTVGAAQAQEAVPLREALAPGALAQVNVRVELAGKLRLPADDKGKPGGTLTVAGNSTIDYDERLLKVSPQGEVERTLRSYRKMSFERKVGEQQQSGALRPSVRRLVILRHHQMEVPFSPDGPLTWNEIDLIRTDVFAPALQGLLSDRPVRPGDTWSAAQLAVKELTDFEKIEKGQLLCRFEEIVTYSNRQHARVSFQGTLEGVGEDGQGRQQLNGFVYVDLLSRQLTYVSMRGVHDLLDKDGKAVGEITGTFVMTRQALVQAPGLSEADLRNVGLEPTDENTQLLFEHPDGSVRFLYPRRWRLGKIEPRQVTLDERRGSGIMLTLETKERTPTAAQFAQEAQTYLQKEKAAVARVTPMQVWREGPRRVESFTIDAEINKQRVQLLYVIVREQEGGILLATRLQLEDLANLQRDVQRVAMSAQLMKAP